MKNGIILLISFLFMSSVFGNVKIEDVNYIKGKQNKVVVKLSEGLKVSPDLKIKENIIQLEIPGSYVWPKIEKKVTWGERKFDTTVTAYQFNKDLVRFRVILPKSMGDQISNINVNEKEKQLEIFFPSFDETKTVRKPSVVKKEIKNDEAFLNQLVAQSETNKAEVTTVDPKSADKYFEDKIQQKFSAEKKDSNSGFSVNQYLLKFLGFLGIILLGFYGVVLAMRKGVMKKGKLGFLNSEKMVDVLSTTYIAPKRSVMMIKAHNQVFLVGSSENGLNLISEINDVTGLIKEGEKRASGTNFDTNLATAQEGDKEFNLKEVITEAAGSNGSDYEQVKEKKAQEVKDSVRISDQIKNKVKNLKALQ